MRTIRHFFPQFHAWIDQIPDPRSLPMVTYHKRFLVWWGLSLFLCKLSSRRQLDYQFNTDGPAVLENLNRLAETAQDSRLATADGPAIDPHEGPGRGPAAVAVRHPD